MGRARAEKECKASALSCLPARPPRPSLRETPGPLCLGPSPRPSASSPPPALTRPAPWRPPPPPQVREVCSHLPDKGGARRGRGGASPRPRARECQKAIWGCPRARGRARPRAPVAFSISPLPAPLSPSPPPHSRYRLCHQTVCGCRAEGGRGGGPGEQGQRERGRQKRGASPERPGGPSQATDNFFLGRSNVPARARPGASSTPPAPLKARPRLQ